MNKEFLDKYSKISVIVIAVILIISFTEVVYSNFFIPYQERRLQEKKAKKSFEEFQERQKNQVLLKKCYTDIADISRQRMVENCATSPYDSHTFSCSSDFLRSDRQMDEKARKDCEVKYPLIF